MANDDKNAREDEALAGSAADPASSGVTEAAAPEAAAPAATQALTAAAAPAVAQTAPARRHGLLTGIAIGVAGTLIVLGGVHMTFGLARGLVGRGAWDGRGGPAWQRGYDGAKGGAWQRGRGGEWDGPNGGGFGRRMPGAGQQQGPGGRGMRGQGWRGAVPSEEGTVTAP